jgi:ubiquinone/menaquinone biosynthesis C-methylase UbiE
MVEWARKQYHSLKYSNLSFKKGNFLETGLVDQFDLIISFCALQHSADQRGALGEISKILKPNGKVLILVPAKTKY